MVKPVIAGFVLLSLYACAWQGETRPAASDHFDGQRFFNPGAQFDKGFFDLVRFAFTRQPGQWKRDLEIAPAHAPPPLMGDGELRVTFINHATLLIQADGINVLTDPIWSLRASPFSWAGPRRFVPPGIAFEDLPEIDVVLISHDHYDHLDLPTLKRLHAEHDPLFVVGLRQGDLLRDHGIQNIQELDWWQPLKLENACQLWGARSQHWTGRGLHGRNRSLWLSFVLETKGGPVYFAGDTGYADHFKQAHQRFGAMRLALLPIGAYQPRWLTAFQHMSPDEAVQAHLDLNAARSLGIHFGTFELADDGQFEPPQALARAVARNGIAPDRFHAPEFGGGYDVKPLEENAGCSQ